MMRRVLDLFLILALLVGGIFAWTTTRERARLEAEYRRLVRSTGELPIGDPSKVHVRALETGEQLHFAWRIYLPPNYQKILRDNFGNRSTGSSSQSVEFIARVRIREDGNGGLEIYEHFSGGSSRGGFADRALAEVLGGRLGKVVVEQLGTGDLVTLDPDEPAVLLRLSLPKEMEAEARTKLSPYLVKEGFFPTIYELKLGPDTPKPSATRPGK